MFAKEGYSTMAVVVVFAAVVCTGAYLLNNGFSWGLYALMIALTGLIFYFFRDPDRDSPTGENLLLAPADGKVVLIKQIEEPVYLKQKATQISIFLSPLDVHVNRVPVSGKLEYVKYHPGKYLVAWNEHSSELNERADFGVYHASGTKFLFRQITGFMARRIVYHIKEGDELTAGRRFGMMKFGSRMDVVVPANVDILVKEGDRTVGGESVMGKIKNHD